MRKIPPIENLSDALLRWIPAFRAQRERWHQESLEEQLARRRKDWEDWKSLPEADRQWVLDQLKVRNQQTARDEPEP